MNPPRFVFLTVDYSTSALLAGFAGPGQLDSIGGSDDVIPPRGITAPIENRSARPSLDKPSRRLSRIAQSG
ncbi:hypothetical protein HNR60_000120 [Rhodopseudomonas rhenobacensis]|uniref:Uncharacterized protein n=1 Tax=Rhodopseudomonas rhenobacensis TaxID=87461 RepID=A0A7W7YZZ2_9BRAD|nr:hypothetical protein [Rhodopseudomonas rhenobacensis]MBB5045391.1 hypothetical protein [Rhodopseudomonas rhenobacensis]